MLEARTKQTSDLPSIPNKRYFTIGDVSKLCDLKNHVLRFWEKEFPQLKPTKRNNRRYYTRDDVLLVRQIKALLYDQGYTVNGARQFLDGEQYNDDVSLYKQMMHQTVAELQEIIKDLKS